MRNSKETIPFEDCAVQPNVILATHHCGGHNAFLTGFVSPHEVSKISKNIIVAPRSDNWIPVICGRMEK